MPRFADVFVRLVAAARDNQIPWMKMRGPFLLMDFDLLGEFGRDSKDCDLLMAAQYMELTQLVFGMENVKTRVRELMRDVTDDYADGLHPLDQGMRVFASKYEEVLFPNGEVDWAETMRRKTPRTSAFPGAVPHPPVMMPMQQPEGLSLECKQMLRRFQWRHDRYYAFNRSNHQRLVLGTWDHFGMNDARARVYQQWQQQQQRRRRRRHHHQQQQQQQPLGDTCTDALSMDLPVPVPATSVLPTPSSSNAHHPTDSTNDSTAAEAAGPSVVTPPVLAGSGADSAGSSSPAPHALLADAPRGGEIGIVIPSVGQQQPQQQQPCVGDGPGLGPTSLQPHQHQDQDQDQDQDQHHEISDDDGDFAMMGDPDDEFGTMGDPDDEDSTGGGHDGDGGGGGVDQFELTRRDLYQILEENETPTTNRLHGARGDDGDVTAPGASLGVPDSPATSLDICAFVEAATSAGGVMNFDLEHGGSSCRRTLDYGETNQPKSLLDGHNSDVEDMDADVGDGVGLDFSGLECTPSELGEVVTGVLTDPPFPPAAYGIAGDGDGQCHDHIGQHEPIPFQPAGSPHDEDGDCFMADSEQARWFVDAFAPSPVRGERSD